MDAAKTHPLPLAVLISGGGTTLRNLIERISRQQLHAEVKLVISSHPQAGGIQLARRDKIPTVVRSRESAASADAFRDSIFQPCRDAEVKLVVMGGFLKHVLIPDDFIGRVMNIHPSLIPAFCGHGCYGKRVHKAVLDVGAKVSGCTVHFVDDQYDHGPIISQRVVDVQDRDTPESLAARVFEKECEAYPEAIQAFADGRLTLRGRRVVWG